MTVWYAKNSSVNINSANQWNDAAAGDGNYLTWADLGANDTLRANGKTAIAVNVDVTCLQLDTLTTGGGFTLGTAVTIDANLVAGTTHCGTTSGGPFTLTIIGDVTGSGSTSNKFGISHSRTNVTVNITGNVYGGTASGTYGIYNASTGPLNVTGNVTGGGNTTAGIWNNSTGAITITGGTLTGGATVNNFAVSNSTAAGTVTLIHCKVINGLTSMAIDGPFIFDPDETSYIQFAAPGATTVKLPLQLPVNNIVHGIVHGDLTGDVVLPALGEVLDSVTYGSDTVAQKTGTYHAPAAAEVIHTASFGATPPGTAGTYHAPEAAEVLDSASVGPAAGVGTYHEAAAAEVEFGVAFGAGSAETGEYTGPTAEDVAAAVWDYANRTVTA